MKRNLILAGCLVLLAGCGKKKLQTVGIPASDGTETWANITQPTGDGVVRGSCIDMKTNQHIACDAPLPLFPMVAPTMRDVVTHHTELSCLKGYEHWELVGNGREISPSEWEAPPEYLVCVTPAFIAELKKANGELK